MPLALQAALVVGGSCTFALLLHRLVRHLVPLHVLEEHHRVAAVLLSLLGGVNGMLLAFVLVTVWQDYEHVREGVTTEVNAAANLARLSAGLPAPAGPQLRDATLAYLQSLVHDEWPRLAEGQLSPEAEEHLRQLWQTLVSFEPKDARSRILYGQSVEQLSVMAEQRRMRLIASRYRLPDMLWGVLWMGTVAIICFLNFFGLRYPRSERLMMVTVAFVLSTVILTILALDHPFSGGIRLSTQEVEEILELLRRP